MDYKDSPYLIEIFDFDVLHMELNTALFIFVLVLLVMFFLNRLLFQPVLRTLDRRGELMNSLQQATNTHRVEIARLTEEYEANLAKMRSEVGQVRQEGTREAQQAVQAILDRARGEAERDFQQAIGMLQDEIEQTRKLLRNKTRGLAEQITKRIHPA